MHSIHKPITIAEYEVDDTPAGRETVAVQWCRECGSVKKTKYFDGREISSEKFTPEKHP